MRSAFGVVHIHKSFVGGKFVRATNLSAKQAKKVRTGGQWKTVRGVTQKDENFRAQMENPQLGAHLAGYKGVKVSTISTRGMKHRGSAGTVRTGSASHGRSYVSGVAGSKKTAKILELHEHQHAMPKRSSYRLHSQIMGDKNKLMREEARADWHAQGHYGNPKKAATVYAAGARATAGRPNARMDFTPADKEELKAVGRKPKRTRIPNKTAAKNAAREVNRQFPHYGLKPKNFKPYRKLQDDFKRRGVAQNPKTFKRSA